MECSKVVQGPRRLRGGACFCLAHLGGRRAAEVLCAGSQCLALGCSLGRRASHCSAPRRSSGGCSGCRGCLALPYRTCRTAMMSCRLHWKACRHGCPQAGIASPMRSQRNGSSLDTDQQVGCQSWEVMGSVLLLWETRGWWQWVSIFPHCTGFPRVQEDSAGVGGQLPSLSGFRGIMCPLSGHMWEKGL